MIQRYMHIDWNDWEKNFIYRHTEIYIIIGDIIGTINSSIKISNELVLDPKLMDKKVIKLIKDATKI